MERKKYIDILKIVSAFSIVLLHVNSNSVHEVQNFLTQLHCDVSFYVHQILYLAVPVFILLTGAGLLASKSFDYKHMWPKIRKILLCIVVFGSIFELANVVVRHANMTPALFFSDLLNGTTWSHMWYLNRILGVYLILPLLGYFVEKASRRELYLFTGICFTFASFAPFAAGLAGITFASFLPIYGVFVPYVMMGYLIDTADEEACRKLLPMSLSAAVIGGVCIILMSLHYGHLIMLENQPLVVITSVSIVFAGKGMATKKVSSGKLLEELSRCTLGIYIVHPIFLHMVSYLGINPQLKLPLLCVPLMAAVIFGVSFLAVWIARRVTAVRKFLL